MTNQLSIIRVSITGKAFYGIMLLRSRLDTSKANEFNKSSNSYYIPVCCLFLYTHCYHNDPECAMELLTVIK